MADRDQAHPGRHTRASAGYALLKAILCLFVFSQALHAQSQPAPSQPPLTSDTIANYLKARVSPVRVMSLVQKYRVNFQLTSDLEARFRSLGASDQILKALRDNYAAPPLVVEHSKQEPSTRATASSVQPSQPAADPGARVPDTTGSAPAPVTSSDNAVSLHRRPPDAAPGSTAPAVSPAPDDTTIYNVGRGHDITAPVPVSEPLPNYSGPGRKNSFSGVVVVEVVVDRQGNVREAQVVNKSSPQLDEKVLEAVRTWKFKPGMRNGQAVVTRERINAMVRR